MALVIQPPDPTDPNPVWLVSDEDTGVIRCIAPNLDQADFFLAVLNRYDANKD